MLILLIVTHFYLKCWAEGSVTFLHGTLNLTLHIPFCFCLPFVVELFAFAQAHVDLHPAAFELDGQGNQGITVLFYLAEEPHDLPLVHQ